MKRLGIRLSVNEAGLGMRVVHPTGVEDKVWDAVEAAIEGGWSVDRFRSKAASAWADYRKREADDEARGFRR